MAIALADTGPATATGAPATEVGGGVAILSALQALEAASHATTVSGCLTALQEAVQWLAWAAQDFASAGDTQFALLADQAAADTEAVVQSGVPADPTAFAQFQASVVEGLLVETADVFDIPLQQRVTSDTTVANSANLAFWGVVGLFGTVVVAAAWIDHAQTRGGYGRGPRGVAHPVVAYDYPPSSR